MENAAILVRGLSKMYKLYRSRPFRLMDFLGLRIGNTGRYFEEFWALRDVTFDIARGSTVGIIGRNGAGKSTLLKVLSGVCASTHGEVTLNGRTSVLLELGTGFHPDLTGHENIFASGLYLGFDQQTMGALYDEIVAFAELGPFLHQPVRTYSTGMYMRLAFAVATCIPADVQIIDEVLGVGDAYFFRKCLERLRRFREEGGTTILVSHDHETVLRLCTRCLWLDRGRIRLEGRPLEVIAAYTRSVQEEQDRKEQGMVSGGGMDLRLAHTLRTAKAIQVKDVEFLTAMERPAEVFTPGEPMTIRIHYRLEVALPHASVSVTTYRLDGVVVLNAISSLDATDLALSAGSGAVDLVFDRLLLGPGEYMVAVGIYPALDLGDPISPQHAVIWHRPDTFTVQQPVGVALDLGVVMHPARWRIARPQEVRDASAANAP